MLKIRYLGALRLVFQVGRCGGGSEGERGECYSFLPAKRPLYEDNELLVTISHIRFYSSLNGMEV